MDNLDRILVVDADGHVLPEPNAVKVARAGWIDEVATAGGARR